MIPGDTIESVAARVVETSEVTGVSTGEVLVVLIHDGTITHPEAMRIALHIQDSQ